VAAVCILSAIAAYGLTFGYDFHGGIWKAAHAILAGRSPYPHPDVHFLLGQLNAYIPPPPFALTALPLGLIPWAAAIAIWTCVSLAGLLGALMLVGVRDRRLYVLAAASFPFVCTLGFGQTEGVLALGVAAAWRWRGTLPGAFAVGAVVGAKLFVWPLVIWLLLTRRFRAAAAAVAGAAALLLLCWSVIGFRGLSAYPRLLGADARAFAGRTHSFTALFTTVGVPHWPAEALGVLCAVGIVAAMLRRARDDRTLFAAAVGFALLASPMLEMHYLTLLLVPLAVFRPRLDSLWLWAANIFWLSPHEPAPGWQIAIVLVAIGAILLTLGRPPVTAGHRLEGAAIAGVAPAGA
jgi:hypothetical protein